MDEFLYARESIQDRFWSKVDKPSEDECWIWKGKRKNNYGWFKVNLNGKVKEFIASRVALYYSGIDIDNTFVLHSCDNPPCCNPKHLRTGTAKDNSSDMIERGRRVGRPRKKVESIPISNPFLVKFDL